MKTLIQPLVVLLFFVAVFCADMAIERFSQPGQPQRYIWAVLYAFVFVLALAALVVAVLL